MNRNLVSLLLVGALLMAGSSVLWAENDAAVDEGTIVWVTDRDGEGRLNLWSINPDGTAASQVTRGFVQALFPAISPCGDLVAFSSADTGTWAIYIIGIDGTGLRRFTRFSSAVPDWSPDGEKLIFNSDHDDEPVDVPDLWGMNLDGTNKVEYLDSPPTADFNPQWAPSGETILFVSNRDGNYNLYLMDADGSNIRRLTDDPANEYNPCWSPDGTKIAYTSDRAGTTDVCVIDADGTNVTCITSHSGADHTPDWSPAGDRIVFVSDRSGQIDLWIVDADGSNPQQLTNDLAPDLHPDWR